MRTKKSQDNLQIENVNTGTVSKKRGRQAGYERPKVYIQINDIYRIDLSDGTNKTIQKFVTRERLEDHLEGLWKAGDKYSDWVDCDAAHCSSYKHCFDRLHDLMVEDKIKETGTVTTAQFYDIYKEKLNWLKEAFTSDFKDDEVASKPKYVKKIEEKKRK
jgi:hypothetical protein